MRTADGADGVLPRRLQLKRVGRIAALAIEDGPEPGRTPSRASHGRQALSGFGYGVPGQCRAGTGGADTLSNPGDRFKLVRFLETIDADTPTFP